MRNKAFLLLALCAIAGICSAAIIYQDNFDGAAGVDLHGRTPNVAPPGVTWVAGSDFDADGTVVYTLGGLGDCAFLPFVPKNGYVYTFSAMIDTRPSPLRSNNPNDWIAMGFSRVINDPSVRFYAMGSDADTVYWMMSRTNLAVANNFDQNFIGTGTNGGNTTVSSLSANNLKVVLNTTAPVWTVSWYYNNVLDRTVNVGTGFAGSTAGGTEAKNYFNYIMISNNQSNGFIDDVLLTGTPLVAWGPLPADGATGLDTGVVFSWNKARDPNNVGSPNPRITSHYLNYVAYDLATAPAEPNFALPTAVRVLVPDTADPVVSGTIAFTPDKRVFWRVDHILSAGGPVIGNLWKFDTLRSEPLITGQPAGVRVFPNGAAQFTTAFYSYSPPAVTWKKYVDGVNDQVIASGGKYGIAVTDASSTLTISSAAIGDQGYYYCEVINESRVRKSSQNAGLAINRRVAYYAFENNLNDSEGGAAGVAVSNDPNYPLPLTFVPGRVGSHAVQLRTSAPAFPGRGQYVDMGAAAFPKAGLGNGMDRGTISCWVKSNTVQSSVLMGNYNNGQTTGFAFSLVNNSNVRINVRGENAAAAAMEIGTVEARPSTSFNMFDNAWQHVAATWQAGDRAAVYVNGKEVGSVAGGTPELFLEWTRGVALGAGRQAANRDTFSSFYSGAIDDLKVYNYVLDKNEMAKLYFDVTGIRPCINTYPSQYDYNNNCVIDLGDFAVLASQWMLDGFYKE